MFLPIILIETNLNSSIVHRSAASSKTVKEGRRIDAKHVKRKQLSTYLPSSVIARNKRSMSSVSLNGFSAPTTPVGTFAQPRKRASDAALDAGQVKKVRTREPTESGTRNLEVRPNRPSVRVYVCRDDCGIRTGDFEETQRPN